MGFMETYSLRWEIKNTHTLKDDPLNKQFNFIAIVKNGEGWMFSYLEWEDKFLISDISYDSNRCPIKFQVENIYEAEYILLKFVQGMDLMNELKKTIYWNENEI